MISVHIVWCVGTYIPFSLFIKIIYSHIIMIIAEDIYVSSLLCCLYYSIIITSYSGKNIINRYNGGGDGFYFIRCALKQTSKQQKK